MDQITNLRREKLHLSDQTWNDINGVFHDEFVRIAQVRKAIHPQMTTADALTVPSDAFGVRDKTLFSEETGTEKVFELQAKYLLTPQQLAGIEQGKTTALILTSRVAVELGLAEDDVLLNGKINNRNGLSEIVTLKSGAPSRGLLDAAGHQIDVPLRNAEELSYGENTYKAIVEGIGHLIGKGENGPYVGIFSFDTFADMNKPLPDRLDTPFDRVKEVLTEGIFSTGAMPMGTGLIISQGGRSAELSISQDFATRFNFIDEGGNYRFEVCGREALTIRVPDALVKLVFEQPVV